MAPSRSQPFKSPRRHRFELPIRKPLSSNSNPDNNIKTISSTSDLPLPSIYLLPTALEPQSINRPVSCSTLPDTQYKKNMKNFTGFDTTEDEFEALPLAVRRKYFSSLERLRLAERANSHALDDLPIQYPQRISSANTRNSPIIKLRRQPLSPRRPRKGSSSNNEASWFLNLPPKIKRKNFTAKERVMLDGPLQDQLILDTADEAIYKARRRANRCSSAAGLYHGHLLPPMASSFSDDKSEAIAPGVCESFRWMDEESDLDLRLALDDYHANLPGAVIPSPASNSRPSFRRQMSITKMPFGRPSLSSLGPRSPKDETFTNNRARRRSRTLSLVGSKHMMRKSVSSIDLDATHYQDPEARLKLRVYLASPQKFDEAIEFGFPSLDGITTEDDKEKKFPGRPSCDLPDFERSFAKGKSFLDDTASLFGDDMSMNDSESPITPTAVDTSFESSSSITIIGPKSTKTSADYSHLGITKPMLVKQNDGFASAMAGNREMTLRMTLTRRDLRADESKIYGWQSSNIPKSPIKSIHSRVTSLSVIEDSPDEIETKGPLGGADGWEPEKEDGGLKRLWNRVRSSQKKI